GAEMKRLVKYPKSIDAVLAEGAARARAIAAPVMKSVREIVGFVQS
ncbi:MAG: tryptophan--tRNA ligase, partial [Xanthobacteraceae bacterium]